MKNIFKTITVIVGVLGIIGFAVTEYGFITFLGACLWGALTRHLANKKGCNKDWGFIYGWVWGLIAVIYYLVCDKCECKEKIEPIV